MIPDSGISTRFPNSSSDSNTHDSRITEILLVIMCLWIVYPTISLGQHIYGKGRRIWLSFEWKTCPKGGKIWLGPPFGPLIMDCWQWMNNYMVSMSLFSFFRSSSWKIIFSFKCIKKSDLHIIPCHSLDHLICPNGGVFDHLFGKTLTQCSRWIVGLIIDRCVTLDA